MILIGILSDDAQTGPLLEESVRNYLEESNIAYRIHSFCKGVEFIRSRSTYDVVFLDDRINDMSLTDAVHFTRIVSKDTRIVLVAEQEQLSLYNHGPEVSDALAKPVEKADVARVLRHVMQGVKNKEGKYFALKTPRGIVSLFTGSIYYVEVYDHELLYHTEMGDFKTYGRLLDIQQKLQGYSFIQCNRSYLVNMRHVQSMNNDHLIVNGTRIQIAKSRHKSVQKQFIDYLGECI